MNPGPKALGALVDHITHHLGRQLEQDEFKFDTHYDVRNDWYIMRIMHRPSHLFVQQHFDPVWCESMMDEPSFLRDCVNNMVARMNNHLASRGIGDDIMPGLVWMYPDITALCTIAGFELIFRAGHPDTLVYLRHVKSEVAHSIYQDMLQQPLPVWQDYMSRLLSLKSYNEVDTKKDLM